jgi:hypothetical protein
MQKTIEFLPHGDTIGGGGISMWLLTMVATANLQGLTVNVADVTISGMPLPALRSCHRALVHQP